MYTTRIELILQLRKSAELGRADWGEVGGVREENGPFVVEELVEVNVSVGGLCLEVGCCRCWYNVLVVFVCCDQTYRLSQVSVVVAQQEARDRDEVVAQRGAEISM